MINLDYNKFTYTPNFFMNNYNIKTEKNNKKHNYGTRFCDELPEDGKQIIVMMTINDKFINIYGEYHKDKQAIFNKYIGFFELGPNDEWVYLNLDLDE